eukprot:gene4844-3473_t
MDAALSLLSVLHVLVAFVVVVSTLFENSLCHEKCSRWTMRAALPVARSIGRSWRPTTHILLFSSVAASAAQSHSVPSGRKTFTPEFGVCFSPAGLLTPYHIGASTCLNDLGCLTDEVAITGSSGGALAAVTAALLMKYPEGTLPLSPLESSVYVAQQCRDLGARGTLRKALDHILEKLLPDDGHEQLNQRRAVVKIAFTSFTRRNGFQARYIDEFHSKADLIDCLRGSCNIPFYFNGNEVFVDVRGEAAFDGFFSVDFRRFGCPATGCSHRELIICPFSSPYVNIQPYALRPETSSCEYDIISPALLDKAQWPFSPTEVLRMALDAPPSSRQPGQPISDEELREKYGILFRAGYESVRRWFESTGREVWTPAQRSKPVDGASLP